MKNRTTQRTVIETMTYMCCLMRSSRADDSAGAYASIGVRLCRR